MNTETSDTWQSRAACAGLDPGLFFPERGESTAAAKAVCSTCPVADECLEYALDEGIKFGIFGGKSERERRKLRLGRPTRLTPIAHGTPAGYVAHRRRGEDACTACTEARTRYQEGARAEVSL